MATPTGVGRARFADKVHSKITPTLSKMSAIDVPTHDMLPLRSALKKGATPAEIEASAIFPGLQVGTEVDSFEFVDPNIALAANRNGVVNRCGVNIRIFSTPSQRPEFFIRKKKREENIIQFGEYLPSGFVYECLNYNKVDVRSLCENRRVAIFGVPGAYQDVYTTPYVPNFITNEWDLRNRGVEEVYVIAVNDAHALKSWYASLKISGKICFLADPQATYVTSLGLDEDRPDLGGVRSRRFFVVADDGFVTDIGIEPDYCKFFPGDDRFHFLTPGI